MTQQDTEGVPLACNPQALGGAAWGAHQATMAELVAQMVAPPREFIDGYLFAFPAATFPTIAAFIDGERRCCPFFTFTLELPPAEATMTLRITGSPETKAVIAATFLSNAKISSHDPAAPTA